MIDLILGLGWAWMLGVFSPVSGKTGSVMVSTTAYAFAKWKVSFKTNLPKVNNFTSVYQQLVGGLTSATVTLSGPYDTGNMPFTTGNVYDFILGWNNSVNLTVPCQLESIDGDQDIDGAAGVSLVGQSTGSFTASIV